MWPGRTISTTSSRGQKTRDSGPPGRSPKGGFPCPSQSDAMYVERMLAVLDPSQRAVVVLHYYLDMSLPDTAAALGIPVGTAKSRLNRALDAMRIKVADDELTVSSTPRERFA